MKRTKFSPVWPAMKMLAELRDAEDHDHAVAAAKRFDAEFRPRWPEAADKIRDDVDVLLMFHNFPAEHWVHHLKTSNPIESRPRIRSPRDQARNPIHNS
jgi:transposase-like protein